MDEIAEGALRVLGHIENRGTEDPCVTLGSFGPSIDSAAAWRNFRARDREATPASANRNIPSPPGIPDIETREDREIIVKVGGSRDQIRKLTPEDLVDRAERQRFPNDHQQVD
ncbi:zinc knuckle domain protein [Penicillium sp. DV-2018c]|nr:zinc knuckle domain protein [Penicillium sp. DV-2018c]